MRKNRYTEEFKLQIVKLVRSGKSYSSVAREYKMSKSTVYKWINDYGICCSFKVKDNISESDKKITKLRKDNIKLRMEVDILKQATLIMAQK